MIIDCMRPERLEKHQAERERRSRIERVRATLDQHGAYGAAAAHACAATRAPSSSTRRPDGSAQSLRRSTGSCATYALLRLYGRAERRRTSI